VFIFLADAYQLFSGLQSVAGWLSIASRQWTT
jgi:hypothetical protein